MRDANICSLCSAPAFDEAGGGQTNSTSIASLTRLRLSVLREESETRLLLGLGSVI